MSKDSKKSLSQYLDSDSIEIDKKDVVKTLQEHISKSGSKGLTSILADMIVKNHSQSLKIKALDSLVNAMNIPVLEGLKVVKKLRYSVRIAASFDLSAEHGFYGLEIPDSGEPFRWTGRNKGVFDLLLDLDRSKSRQLKLTILKNEYSDKIVGKNIFLNVDDENILPIVKDSKKTTTYVFDLDPVEKDTSTHCVFSTDTWRPVDLVEGAGDDRNLGVMFVKLEAS